MEYRLKTANAADETQAAEGWDELRGILRAVAPVAVLVWIATLAWTFTESPGLTAAITAVVTAIATATLFCPAEHVRLVWVTTFQLAIGLAVLAGVGITLFVGVQIAFAVVSWIAMFPFQHPVMFIAGVILLLVIWAGANEQETTKSGREGDDPDTGAILPQPKRTRKRARKRWSIETRRRVWAACDHACYYCDRPLPSWRGRDMHLDHVNPLARDGPDEEANLVAACPTCNLEKQAKHYPELQQ